VTEQSLPRPPLVRRAGWLRASLPGEGLPPPESLRRRMAIRAVALLALGVGLVYLGWRLTSTLDPAVWWVSFPLFALEVHALLGLALFTFSLWDVDRRPATRDVTETDARIAVLIPTYNEGPEILLPTIAAALTMRLPHETWVLDDGARPEIAALAERLGARYLARTEHRHAKAGNLNHALGVIEADLIAVLDADHVASPDFLVRTLGYFDDPRVALVQTPQEFYNRHSFEHDAAPGDGERFHEQALFYRVLQPGKNRWSAAFWCGTGAVVRVSALRAIGGVATDTITEDIHTTIRLHRRGWRTVYHNEVLAQGLAAPDADTYQAQRLRWGTGAMQVLRTENPLVVPGLTLPQRLAYASTLLGWFDAWRTLALLWVPIVVLATGAVPIRADATTFAVAFASSFILQQVALRVLSRGCHRSILSVVFELVRMTSNLRATATLVTRGRPVFSVTPKGRTADGRRRVRAPLPLTLVLVASFAAAAWFALSLLGVTPVRYSELGAMVATLGWLVADAALVLLAIGRIRSLHYGPERRASVRFDVALEGELDRFAVEVLDVSLTGARLRAPIIRAVGERGSVALRFRGESVELPATVRTISAAESGTWRMGLEFDPTEVERLATLALLLFRERTVPRVEPVAPAPAPALPAGAAAA